MSGDQGELRHPEDRADPDEWGPAWTDPPAPPSAPVPDEEDQP